MDAIRSRLREKKVTINESKSIKLTDHISFLGFRISSKGITPDERLVNKIKELKEPTSRAEIESFIGLINYFGRLIPKFTEKTRIINELRKKNKTFSWTK